MNLSSGRIVKEDSESDSENKISKYPGLSVEDLELQVKDQLKLVLYHGFAKKGTYCVKVEDTSSQSVFDWFSLERPQSDFVQIKIVDFSRKKGRSSKTEKSDDQRSQSGRKTHNTSMTPTTDVES